MSRYRSGPSPLIVVLVGALLVFGGYYVWLGFVGFLENRGDITANVTREAMASATAFAAPPALLPTLYMPPTFTPLPPCMWFEVDVERAVYRECPSQDDRECPIREVVPFGTELCIYARVPGNSEWYVVDLNPDGAYRDTVYIHESVVDAINPTPTITVTFTPLPTVTTTPSLTPPAESPTPAQPSATPAPAETDTPWPPTITPTFTPRPSQPEVSI